MAIPNEYDIVATDAAFLSAEIAVQCWECGEIVQGVATRKPDDNEDDGGELRELSLECSNCSKAMSASEGRKITRIIPVVILVGSEVEKWLPEEDNELIGDGTSVEALMEAHGIVKGSVVPLPAANESPKPKDA